MYMTCSSCRVNVISQDMSESKQIAQESRIHMERFVVYISCLSVCPPICLCVLFACLYIFNLHVFFVCLICTKFNLQCKTEVVVFLMGFLDVDSTAYIHHIYKHTVYIVLISKCTRCLYSLSSLMLDDLEDCDLSD